MSSPGYQNQNQSGNWSSQNNVCLGPAMDSAAVSTGKFLSLHFCGLPPALFNRATSISQLRRRRTTHEQAFQIAADFRLLSPLRWFEIISSCHFGCHQILITKNTENAQNLWNRFWFILLILSKPLRLCSNSTK